MWKLPGRTARAALREPEAAAWKGRARALISGTLWSRSALAAPVYGERSQSENLIIYLRGGVSPRTLPRDHSSPVSVRLQAGIETANSVPLPRVKKIRLELAYRGALDTYGLPVCRRARLRALDTRHAIAACGAALVGRGSLYARVFLPSQAPFGLHARLLAFNGKTRRAAPRSGSSPTRPIHRSPSSCPSMSAASRGPFRTVLVSVVPRDVGPWPHFAHFSMVVSRRFRYLGRMHSYLSASCPLPPRFTSGLLSLARATFSIDDASRLNVETVRTCRAD